MKFTPLLISPVYSGRLLRYSRHSLAVGLLVEIATSEVALFDYLLVPGGFVESAMYRSILPISKQPPENIYEESELGLFHN